MHDNARAFCLPHLHDGINGLLGSYVKNEGYSLIPLETGMIKGLNENKSLHVWIYYGFRIKG